MNTYEQSMYQEYMDNLQAQIPAFVAACNLNLLIQNPPPPTIFLFPGGLGSKLKRAVQSVPNGPPYNYYTVWLDCTVVFGIVSELQLTATPSGYQDSQDEYIVPDGAIDFIQSYDGFIQWCVDNNLPLFVFGWDWRRQNGDAADFFLTQFLPAIDAEVANGTYAYNPTSNFWLIGHSFGGMVVKSILNQAANGYVQKMKGAITVATPFYGTGGCIHRFFVGESDANATLWPNGAAKCTKIVSTLPANYEILFLSLPTYNANQAALLQDPFFSPQQYPITDATTGQPADPYNPVPGAPPPNTAVVRYIPNYNFSWQLLGDGQASSVLTAQALAGPIAAKFWNVRCVQTDSAGNHLDGTVVSQTWAEVDANFDPDVGPDPITDHFGAGDGVVPAWSARLLGLANSNVVTLFATGLEHQDLLNEDVVQAELATLLKLPPLPTALVRVRAKARRIKAAIRIEPASRAELDAFLAQLREVRGREHSPEKRTEAVIKLVRSLSLEQRKALLTRAYFDAFKSPSQLSGSSKGAPTKGSKVKTKTKSRTKPKAKRKGK